MLVQGLMTWVFAMVLVCLGRDSSARPAAHSLVDLLARTADGVIDEGMGLSHQGLSQPDDMWDYLASRRGGQDLFDEGLLTPLEPEGRPSYWSGGQRLMDWQDAGMKRFFRKMFVDLRAASRRFGFDYEFSRWDLFHGHVFFRAGAPEPLIVVFHAKEYPRDLPGSRGHGSPFSTTDEAFAWRNSFYLASRNRFVFARVDEGSPFFDPWAFPPGVLGDLKEELYDGVLKVKTMHEDHLSAAGYAYVGDVNFVGGRVFLALR